MIKLVNLKLELGQQELIVSYFEEVLKVLQKITFSVNNYIDLLKLKQGDL
jgi:hypothetical protein